MKLTFENFGMAIMANENVKEYVAELEQHKKLDLLVKQMIKEPDIYGRRFIGSAITSMTVKQGKDDPLTDALRRFAKRIVGFATETHFDHRVALSDALKTIAADDYVKLKDPVEAGDFIQAVIPKTQDWNAYGSGVTFLTTLEFLDENTAEVISINLCFEVLRLNDKINVEFSCETPNDNISDEYDLPSDVYTGIGRMEFMFILFLHHALKSLDAATQEYANSAFMNSIESTFQIMMKSKVHDKMEQDKGFTINGPMELFDPRHIECVLYELNDDHTEPVKLKLVAYDTTNAPTCGVTLTASAVKLSKTELDELGNVKFTEDITDQYPDAIPLIEESRDAMFFVLKGALKEFPL